MAPTLQSKEDEEEEATALGEKTWMSVSGCPGREKGQRGA